MSLKNCNSISKRRGLFTILKNKSFCTGCHACYHICPEKAIKMCADSEGFLYPEVDQDKCIECGQCKKVCPVLNKPIIYPEMQAFAAYAKDEAEHKSSSSGGVFAVLARDVLKHGGAVCGAAFTEKLKVQHVIIEENDALPKLKETKYVQSEIGEIFLTIKSMLISGRQVLFSGTPCQVAGLKNYLGKDYSRLLCIDLICHGVPSPKVFSRYLQEISNKPIVKMTFRNKKMGISNVMLDYEDSDGVVVQEKYGESPYIMGFIQNLYTRPSCFQCNFKGEKRASDLTIGDFWGVEEFHPSFITEQGVSAVIIHSQKGVQAFNEARSNLVIESATIKEISAWNSCLIQSIEPNQKRRLFFDNWEKQTIQETVLELCGKKQEKIGFMDKVKGRIKQWLV